MTFHTPPRNQGQIVTVSYAAVEGNVIQQIHDASDGSIRYYISEMLEDDQGDYWNGEPDNNDWRKLTAEKREQYGFDPVKHTFEYRECTGYTEELDVEDMDEAEQEAEDLLRSGSWGDEGGWVDATITEFDEDGEEVDSRSVNVLLEPEEPKCVEDEHDWTQEGEGGLKENPGVWSVGSGAILTRSHCTHCGIVRKVISGDCNPPSCGNQDGVRYEEPSFDWVQGN